MNCVIWGTEGRSVPCVRSKIDHKVGHFLHEYLHHFIAAHNTGVSTALDKLALQNLSI